MVPSKLTSRLTFSPFISVSEGPIPTLVLLLTGRAGGGISGNGARYTFTGDLPEVAGAESSWRAHSFLHKQTQTRRRRRPPPPPPTASATSNCKDLPEEATVAAADTEGWGVADTVSVMDAEVETVCVSDIEADNDGVLDAVIEAEGVEEMILT